MHGKVFSRLMDRPVDSNKYDFGHVLVVGGSPGMVGAPLLAGMAALRTGAGLVTIAAAAETASKLEERVKEIMTVALPGDGRAAAGKLEDFIAERKVTVIIIGPGLAVTSESRGLVASLVRSVGIPLIIDGGGLGALQGHAGILDEAASKRIILTPHTGEFRRLIGEEPPKERELMKPLALAFAKAHGVTLVLKGEPTYVAGPDGRLYENPTGNPGLATAGTGDVLAGVIGGMIAQRIDAGEAAEAGVYLHGLAGDIAAAGKTVPGMIAGDVIEALPEALAQAAGNESAGREDAVGGRDSG